MEFVLSPILCESHIGPKGRTGWLPIIGIIGTRRVSSTRFAVTIFYEIGENMAGPTKHLFARQLMRIEDQTRTATAKQ